MEKNKPIYLVVTPFFPTDDSFRGPFIYDQVRAIIATGRYDVRVLMPAKCDSSYVYQGVEVTQFKERALPSASWPGLFDAWNVKSFDRCLQRLGIGYADVCVVHSHVTHFGVYAVHAKSRNPAILSVLQHHGYDVLSLTNGRLSCFGWHRRHVRKYGIGICNAVDLHVGVSRQTLEYLAENNEISPKATYALYNGVDLTKFRPLGRKQPRDSYHIGCVANFWKIKDQMTLIKAVDSLAAAGEHGLYVTFVGTGALKAECEAYVREHGLSEYVEFRTEVDHRELCAYYNSLDLFVLPSYWDAFGCVYLEAYACGVPFITAKGSGIVEMLPEENRQEWVIAPHDFEGLARKIRRLMHQARTADVTAMQPLAYPYDIRTLVGDFLDYIDTAKR